MPKDTSLDNDIVDEAVTASVYADAAGDDIKEFAQEGATEELSDQAQDAPPLPKNNKVLGLPKPLALILGVSVVAFVALILINSFKTAGNTSTPVQEETAFIDAVEGEAADFEPNNVFDSEITFDEESLDEEQSEGDHSTTSLDTESGTAIEEANAQDPFAQIKDTVQKTESMPNKNTALNSNTDISTTNTTPSQDEPMDKGAKDDSTLLLILEELNTISSRIDMLEIQSTSTLPTFESESFTALTNDVKSIMKTVNAQSKSIESLKEQVKSSTPKAVSIQPKKENDVYVPPNLIWMTWVDGRGIARVEGTSREISIEPGEQLKGRGVVKEVTESGCITFTYNMPSYAPENGSCN